MRRALLYLCVLSALGATALPQNPETLEEAMSASVLQNKPILIEFTLED